MLLFGGCFVLYLNETFDHLSDNLGIPSTQQNNKPLILNENVR